MQRHCDFDPTLNTGNIKRRWHIEDMTNVFLKPWLSLFRTLYIYILYFIFYILGLFSRKYCGYKLPSEKIATWIMLCKQMLSRSVFDFNFTRQVLQKRWCLQTTKTRLLLSWHYSPKTACSLNIVDLKLDNNPHETKLLK